MAIQESPVRTGSFLAPLRALQNELAISRSLMCLDLLTFRHLYLDETHQQSQAKLLQWAESSQFTIYQRFQICRLVKRSDHLQVANRYVSSMEGIWAGYFPAV